MSKRLDIARDHLLACIAYQLRELAHVHHGKTAMSNQLDEYLKRFQEAQKEALKPRKLLPFARWWGRFVTWWHTEPKKDDMDGAQE